MLSDLSSIRYAQKPSYVDSVRKGTSMQEESSSHRDHDNFMGLWKLFVQGHLKWYGAQSWLRISADKSAESWQSQDTMQSLCFNVCIHTS